MKGYTVTETLLNSFSPGEVSEMVFTVDRPFDDNGGDTDGPSYFLEAVDLREGSYGVEIPETFGPKGDIEGYRMEGYDHTMLPAFKSAGIRRWIGNHILKNALFIATEDQLAALEAALAELYKNENENEG